MNIREIKQFIKAADLCNQVPLIEGVHGLGKSDTVRQYAKENSLHPEILILSLMDTSDLLGMPRTANIGGQQTTVWAAPQWFNNIVDRAWPTKVAYDDLQFKDKELQRRVSAQLGTSSIDRGNINEVYCAYMNITNDRLHITTQDLVGYKHAQRSVLFLDELNRSPLDVRQASLQLILDKCLHSHVLPTINGIPTYIVAAINPADGDYATDDLDPALKDRFIHATMEADAASWLEWARENDLAPVVRDFIAEYPDRIWYQSKDGKSSATPRSWASLAKTMAKIDQIPLEIQFQLMKGNVGQELASQFLSFYNNYSKVVKMADIEEVIEKKAKTTKDINKLSVPVVKLIQDQEAIQKTELAEQFFTKYITKTVLADALPLIVYLNSLELEILNGFLRNKREDDITTYMKLAEIDGELNDKALFKKVTSKIPPKK